MVQEFGLSRRNQSTFPGQVVGHRLVQASVGQPMERSGAHRIETPPMLVRALRARVETAQSLSQAQLDALVVAALEVQRVVVRLGGYRLRSA
jgi:hypothetical protein